MAPLVFRAPEAPAAREARRPHFVRRRASKPGQAPPPPTSTAARPHLHPAHLMPLIAGYTTNFACNSLATLSNHEVTTLELQRFRAVLNLRPVELPAELVEPIPTTTHTPSKDVVGFTKVPQSPDTGTSSFTTRRVE